MKKILSELNEAFVLLSTISLAGDAVDTMAAAKTILRKAAGELKEMDTAGASPRPTGGGVCGPMGAARGWAGQGPAPAEHEGSGREESDHVSGTAV